MPKKVNVDTYQIGDLRFIVTPEPEPAPAPAPCPAPPCTPRRVRVEDLSAVRRRRREEAELTHGWGHGPTPRRDPKTSYYVFD